MKVLQKRIAEYESLHAKGIASLVASLKRERHELDKAIALIEERQSHYVGGSFSRMLCPDDFWRLEEVSVILHALRSVHGEMFEETERYSSKAAAFL